MKNSPQSTHRLEKKKKDMNATKLDGKTKLTGFGHQTGANAPKGKTRM